MPRLARIATLLAALAILLIAALILARRTSKSEAFTREARVAAGVREIHVAERQYHSQFGRYAMTLGELAPLLDRDLARGVRDGYRILLTGDGSTYAVTVAREFAR